MQAPLVYPTPESYLSAPRKAVALFGMSGLGKTRIASLLRDRGSWFHYSIDYRIGTRYMGEHIADNFKAEAMKVPFLAELLRTDSIYVASNITFDNLAPLSTYVGKPGDPAKGGIAFEEYMRRQDQHRQAEISATLDTTAFIDRAERLYGYTNFVCDSSGSICEVVDPWDAEDPVMTELAANMAIVWIKGSDAHTAELVRRFDRAPKPMYYQPEFLAKAWDAYREETGEAHDRVDPDAFVRWTYARALAHRAPRYAAIADRWGLTVTAEEIWAVGTPDDFIDLVAAKLAEH